MIWFTDEIVSDCWNDVDETEFACKEKERIMLKLKPPGYENAIDTDRLIPKNRRGTVPNTKIDTITVGKAKLASKKSMAVSAFWLSLIE